MMAGWRKSTTSMNPSIYPCSWAAGETVMGCFVAVNSWSFEPIKHNFNAMGLSKYLRACGARANSTNHMRNKALNVTLVKT